MAEPLADPLAEPLADPSAEPEADPEVAVPIVDSSYVGNEALNTQVVIVVPTSVVGTFFTIVMHG